MRRGPIPVALPRVSGHTRFAAPPPRLIIDFKGGSVPTPERHLPTGPQPRLLPSQVAPPAPNPEVQRRRMLIALAVLLVTLVAVILKDWDFWFPPSQEAPATAVVSRTVNASQTTTATTSAPVNRSERHPAKFSEPAPTPVPLSATAERTVLPALQVEVVAGNRHTQVPARNSAIRLDLDSGVAAPVAGTQAGKPEAPVNAADRVQLSPQTQQSVSVSVPPDYPLLARQMKVQGAVILQALISREGSIQELQIVSGPSILAAAAREAVKQWRFKPYYQSGQPVETQARITVNFTISTN